jgi:hypothetical protein
MSELGYTPAVELDDDLAVAVVVDLLKLANVACGDGISNMSREI